MKILIEFLTLRPVFTRSALRIVWYVYLAATLLQIAQYVIVQMGTVAMSRGVSPFVFVSLLPPLFLSLAQLTLVRIFLEIAMQFIEKKPIQS